MSLNKNQNLGYTVRHSIDFGRSVFLSYAQQKKMNEFNLLRGYKLISPDKSMAIMTAVEEGAAHTTPEELDRYIYELLAQLDLLPPIPKKPNTPTILFGESGDKEILIYFTAGKPVDDPVTNYKYSTDGGATFREFSPSDTISPLSITSTSSAPYNPLVNGISYTVLIKAINAIGDSEISNDVTVIPLAQPEPPINLSAQAGNKSVIIYFDAGDTGGVDLRNYLYSTDGGENPTFIEFDPPVTESPVTITKVSSDGTTTLDNGTEYTISMKTKTDLGVSDPSESITAIPQSVPEPPTITYTLLPTGEIQITISFGDDGGVPIEGYEYTTDDGQTFVSGSL
jgi:hypothetical protein